MVIGKISFRPYVADTESEELDYLRKQNQLLKQFLSVYREIMNNIQDVKDEKFEDAFFV